MNNIKKYRNSKGITMVALVITIIVLLILAGITIRILMGDSNIINQALHAKEATEYKDLKEDITNAWYLLQNDTNFGYYTPVEMANLLEEKLAKSGKNDVTVHFNEEKNKYEVNYKDHLMEVDTDGTVAAEPIEVSSTELTKHPKDTIDLSTFVSNTKGKVSYELIENGTTTPSILNGSTLTIGTMSPEHDDDQTVKVKITDTGYADIEGTNKTVTITVQKYTRTLNWTAETPSSIKWGDNTKSATVNISGTGGVQGDLVYSVLSGGDCLEINSTTGKLTTKKATTGATIQAEVERTTTVKQAIIQKTIVIESI